MTANLGLTERLDFEIKLDDFLFPGSNENQERLPISDDLNLNGLLQSLQSQDSSTSQSSNNSESNSDLFLSTEDWHPLDLDKVERLFHANQSSIRFDSIKQSLNRLETMLDQGERFQLTPPDVSNPNGENQSGFTSSSKFGWVGDRSFTSPNSQDPQLVCGCLSCAGPSPQFEHLVSLNQNQQNSTFGSNNTSLVPAQARVSSTGDPQIDAVLNGYKWGTKTITFSFYDDDIPNSYYGNEQVSEVSEGIKTNVRTILKNLIEPFVNLKFVEVQDTQSAYGLIRYHLTSMTGYAYAYYPTSTDYNQGSRNDIAGDVHLSTQNDKNDNFNGFQSGLGSHGFLTLIHETLHAIGLKHPGNYNGSGTGDAPFLPGNEDNLTNTVMSYNFAGAKPVTPMLYDIKALHHLYGAKAHNASETTYVFDHTYSFSDSQRSWGTASQQAKVLLWDSGGLDTLDFSKLALSSSGYRFDLREGGLLTSQSAYNSTSYQARGSSTGATHYTTTFGTVIAYNTVIENLVNSSSSDRIILNQSANTIRGYQAGKKVGDDIIVNANSQDTLDLSAYTSSSVTQTTSGNDLILKLGNDGSITIKDHFSVTQENQIKILFNSPTPTGKTITGTASNDQLEGTAGDDSIRGLAGDDTLNGLAGNDTIHGNHGIDTINGGDGKDRIVGGVGNDILTGGGGDDTFVYQNTSHGRDTITDFDLSRDKLDFSEIFAAANYSSADAFGSYIKILGTSLEARVQVDTLGDTGDQFKTLAILTGVNATSLNASHLIT
jgi:Ca2+-binding RTX toxin-like protein